MEPKRVEKNELHEYCAELQYADEIHKDFLSGNSRDRYYYLKKKHKECTAIITSNKNSKYKTFTALK